MRRAEVLVVSGHGPNPQRANFRRDPHHHHRGPPHHYADVEDNSYGTSWLWIAVFATIVILGAALFISAHPPTAATAAATTSSAAARATAAAAAARARASTPRLRVERHWQEVSPGVYDLGDAVVVNAETGVHERSRGFVHMIYADGYLPRGADELAADNVTTAPAVESCSDPLLDGLKWDSTFKWIVDPTNGNGISRQLAVDSLWSATNEFERRLSDNVVTGQDVDDCADGIDLDSPDGKNEFMFVFIEESGVLAFMAGWVTAGKLVNVDIAVSLHFDWGDADTTSGVFDLFNILSHEVGHAYGMGHISTSLATMQPTASEDETHKRDLLECEQIGLCDMYGQSPTTSCTAFLKPALAAFVDVGSGSRCEGTVVPSVASDVSLPHAAAILSATMLVASWA